MSKGIGGSMVNFNGIQVVLPDWHEFCSNIKN